MSRTVRTFTVTVVNDDRSPTTAEDVRDSLLDAWGFPQCFVDHPEHLKVTLDNETPERTGQ